MLLVFGDIPRLVRNNPTATQLMRARANNSATKEAEIEQANRRIAQGFCHPSSTKIKGTMAILEELPAGAPVLVYRTKQKAGRVRTTL